MRFPNEIPQIALDIIKQINTQHRRLELELQDAEVDEEIEGKLLAASGLVTAMLRVTEGVVNHKQLLGQIKQEIYSTI
jgi:hypothetical protein